MKTIKRKYYILDKGVNLRTYDGVCFVGDELTIVRPRNYAAIELAIKFLTEVL